MEARSKMTMPRRNASSLVRARALPGLLFEYLTSTNEPQPQGCWTWLGATTNLGYGRFHLAGKLVQAHHYSYLIYCGNLPNGSCVCHSCDNPRCVNPEHLFLGTHSDNMRDMHRKKRGNKPKGINHHKAVLTEAIVQKIRKTYIPGSKRYGLSAYARKYGVLPGAIWSVVNGKTWSHVV